MKRFFFVFFIIIFSSFIFCQEGGEVIDNKWIKIKLKVRANYKKEKLAELDKQTLDALEKSQIPEDVENELSELLYDILNDNILFGRDNSLKALEILYKQFKNKKYFFDTASEYAYSNPNGDFKILSKIFIGLTGLIEGYYNENMNTVKIVYESMRASYLSGKMKYGTDTVLKYYVAYLREYLRLVNEDKIEEDPKKKYIITYMYNELNLEKKTSNFLKVEGAEELKKEYFFLNEKNEKNENNSSSSSKNK